MSRNAENELAELAGGFIHDLKNRLGNLSLNLQLLSEDLAEAQSRRAQDRVSRLSAECERLTDLSNDFLRFARVKDLDRTRTDLHDFVEDIVAFFEPMAKSRNIEIKCFVPAGLPPVDLDHALFKQSLLNLLLNAQQAIPPTGGEITLQAAAEGKDVVLSVIDTGKGMSPQVLARAFSPFYTTRPEGTGLGLPTTKKVVEAHGGTIAAESAAGKGTRFVIRLPHAGDADSKPKVPPPLCILDGARMALSEAKISVLDRGFLFGDGIYEVLRVYRGRPWLADNHFARLSRSLDAIRIQGVSMARLRAQCAELIAAGPYREALVYIQVTRGVGPRGHAFPKDTKPTELVWVKELDAPYAKERATGVKVAIYDDLRWRRCDVKSVNLLGNVLANQHAREHDAAEAVLVMPDGTLTEASHSSFFGVKNGVIFTTPDGPGILPGVTRKFLLDLAAEEGVEVVFRSLKRQELSHIDELFLTGTSMEVVPVVQVDDMTIGGGLPGPVAKRLQAAYDRRLAAWLAE